MTSFWQQSTTRFRITGRWLAILVELQVSTQENAMTPSSDKSGFATYQSKAALILPYKNKRGYHQNCNKPRKTRTATNLQTRKQSLSATCDPGFLGTTTNFPSRQPSHTHLCKCCRWWYLGTPAERMGRGQRCLTTIQPFWRIYGDMLFWMFWSTAASWQDQQSNHT